MSRYDGERTVQVSGTIVSDNIGQVTADVSAAIDELALPEGVEATTRALLGLEPAEWTMPESEPHPAAMQRVDEMLDEVIALHRERWLS